jgi:hypothetical protein
VVVVVFVMGIILTELADGFNRGGAHARWPAPDSGGRAHPG